MFILVSTLEESLTVSHQILFQISELGLIIPPQVKPSCMFSSFYESRVNRLMCITENIFHRFTQHVS